MLIAYIVSGIVAFVLRHLFFSYIDFDYKFYEDGFNFKKFISTICNTKENYTIELFSLESRFSSILWVVYFITPIQKNIINLITYIHRIIQHFLQLQCPF